MRIAICDDERCYIDAIISSIKRWQTQNKVEAFSITTYSSSEDLIEFSEQSLPFDLAFLDIQFPGELNGLQLARELRNHNDQISIVFMTNFDEYAIEGYKVNALRFLQKPIIDIHVFECLDIAYRQWVILNGTSIIVECNQSVYRLPTNSILYIESKAHYLYIHTTTSNTELITRQRLPEFLETLPNNILVRCHRSFAVNIFHIYCISRNSIVLSNGESLPISDKYWKTIHGEFKSFYKGE